MKIIFISTTFPSPERPKIGSFNLRAAKQISRVLDLTVITLRAWRPGRKLIKKFEYHRLDIIEVALPYLPDSNGTLTAFFIFLYKHLSYFLLKDIIQKADVLHSVGISLSGIVCSHWARKLQIKHIAQTIGTDVNYRIGPIKNQYGVKGWENNIDYLVGNSKSLVIEFQKHYPCFPVDKLKVIYRGIDVFNFPFSPLSEIPNPITFLFLGGISPDNTIEHGRNFKGIVTLLDAWELVVNEQNNDSFNSKLVIGGPRTANSEYLQARLEISTLGAFTDVIGELSHDEIKSYLKVSTVVIIPSMAEGLPNVALEALSTGRPVIASNIGGVPEVIEHNKNGFLFEAGNKQELARLINYCITNSHLLSELGLYGRKQIETQFDSCQFSKYYFELYEN